MDNLIIHLIIFFSLFIKIKNNNTNSIIDSNSNLNNFLQEKKFLICGFNICSIEGSICNNLEECLCKKCFITINLLNDHRKCNYEQTSAFNAGIIEILFPIGFGHFYIGSFWGGVAKMFMTYFMICGVYVIVIYFFIFLRKNDSSYDLFEKKNLNVRLMKNNFNISERNNFRERERGNYSNNQNIQIRRNFYADFSNNYENSNLRIKFIKTAEEDIVKIKRIVLLSQILFVIFHVVDLYNIFMKKYTDNNNINLC